MEEENKQNHKEVYEKLWFWVVVVICAIIIIYIGNSGNKKQTSSISENNKVNSTNTYSTSEKIKKVEVTVADFSKMTKEEIQNWCTSNKVICNITDEYSDTVEKGSFVSQSAKENSTVYQGDKITIIYSLGKEPTMEEKNALKKAESYSKTMHMSKKGIYNQLTSEYGEGFSAEAAQYAIDNMVADWKANALAKAKSYQTTMNMSKNNIYKQLISEYGEKFTAEEAQYAIDNLDN